MTLIEKVKKGIAAPIIAKLAASEGVSRTELAGNIASGTAVIPKNKKRPLRKPCAIGKGLRTKINAHLGTSEDHSIIDFELRK